MKITRPRICKTPLIGHKKNNKLRFLNPKIQKKYKICATIILKFLIGKIYLKLIIIIFKHIIHK